MAGLIGTLVSTVIVPASNHRSLNAAGKYVTHNWKIKVDEISVEVDCTGKIIRGGGFFDEGKRATLKWTVNTNGLNYKSLVNLQKVQVTSTVELRAQKGETLWTIVDPQRGVNIKLDAKQANGKLKVTLSDRWKGGKIISWLGEFGSFDCQWPIESGRDAQKVYQASLDRLQKGEYKFIRTDVPVPITVELDSCSWAETEKQFECNLKVTYEDVLNWKDKITAKARISFE